jgi:selenocysteine lyase/cysteine desulfurase
MLTPAGPDHAQIAAVAGLVDYLDAVYAHHFSEHADSPQKGRALHTLFSTHEKTLLAPLLDFLKSRDDVRIIGPDDVRNRAATVTILPLRKKLEDVAGVLAEEKLMVATGNFYGVRPLGAMGIDLDPGVLRMSLVHYNTMAEIEQLLAGLSRALA